MPQRYPDPDRGHRWALLDSILLFLSELVDAGQRALCIMVQAIVFHLSFIAAINR
jgi:hypothetical protein